MKSIIFALLIGSITLFAGEGAKKSTSDTKSDSAALYFDFPSIDVVGKKEKLTSKIPGSASLITNAEIRSFQPLSGNEVIRKMAGVNVVDEEGTGLRLNIGVRGLDPDRSRTLLVLEDGVPVALAPYGEPEMYYTPPIERMSGLELLKGSGSILWGPQTIGGVLNYKTIDPPVESASYFNIRGGDFGLFSAYGSYGTQFDNTGIQIGYLHKQADKIVTTKLSADDLTAKIKFQLNENSHLGVKLSFYNEESNATYLGLTQSMYDAGQYYTVMAPNDKLKIRRYAASINHNYILDASSFIKSTVFAYTTTRNWLRQDFTRSKISNAVAVHGDTSVSGGAVYMRNSTGNRDRQFEVIGAESRYSRFYSAFGVEHEVEAGLRGLFEKAYEQRINGKKYNAVSGDLVDDEIRTGIAGSFFVQNRVHLNKDLVFTPGIRFEHFSFERDIYRIGSKDTSLNGTDKLFSVIPGAGLNYKLNPALSFFAGVHKGYAPPRVKDAIDNSGTSLKLDAEQSVNYEFGVRFVTGDFDFEATGFRLDFSNQVIPVSASSGGAGTGYVNGGRTMHNGAELSLTHRTGTLFSGFMSLTTSVNATYSDAVYSSDRFVKSGSTMVNVKDNKLPYSPELVSNLSLAFLFKDALLINFNLIYTDEQFGDELNSTTVDYTGEKGIIPSHAVMDLTAKYFFNQTGGAFYVSVKNLADERYIASRRPQGIKPGAPRLLMAGVELTL